LKFNDRLAHLIFLVGAKAQAWTESSR